MGIVIQNQKPRYLTMTELLIENVEQTKTLIKKELEIRLHEIAERQIKLELERIFIENKIYLELENAEDHEEGVMLIKSQLQPKMKPFLQAYPHIKGIQHEHYEALTEIKIRRIGRYDAKAALLEMEKLNKEKDVVSEKLEKITETVKNHFVEIKAKYGKGRERKTRIQKEGFQKLEIKAILEKTNKIFVNKTEGFIGTSLKKEELLPFEVASLTDVVAINNQGITIVKRPEEKTFYAANLLHITHIPQKTDEETAPIYNMIYTDTASGITYAKRFQLCKGFTRNTKYLLAGGVENPVHFLQVQTPQETPPQVKIKLSANSNCRKQEIEYNFNELAVKNRTALGNTVTKYAIETISI
jgi:topoisomerase-4 subunit A